MNHNNVRMRCTCAAHARIRPASQLGRDSSEGEYPGELPTHRHLTSSYPVPMMFGNETTLFKSFERDDFDCKTEVKVSKERRVKDE